MQAETHSRSMRKQGRASSSAALLVLIVLIALMATACGTPQSSSATPAPSADELHGPLQPVTVSDMDLAVGQTLYVPAYSQIFSGDAATTFDLTVTLSIRNTDLTNPIIIRSIHYYDSAGQLVREYVEAPLELAPMGTSEVVIAGPDRTGGTGANFIVEWGAPQPVHEPVVEALMVSTAAQQGLSFLTEARVLEETP